VRGIMHGPSLGNNLHLRNIWDIKIFHININKEFFCRFLQAQIQAISYGPNDSHSTMHELQPLVRCPAKSAERGRD
jgi:hypothetical protein